MSTNNNYSDLMECILCASESQLFFTDAKSGRRYLYCNTCDLRFLSPDQRLSSKDEFDRYKLHTNFIDDPGYQKFVEPLYELIKSKIPEGLVGLDFGCGDGPVLAHLLSFHNYKIELYDPFFRPNKELLDRKYDFVFAVEVIEHFFNLENEFKRLRELLVPSGSLFLMTHIYTETVNFDSWYYRQDPTHVCFYSSKTFKWIRAHLNFRSFQQIGDRIILLEK